MMILMNMILHRIRKTVLSGLILISIFFAGCGKTPEDIPLILLGGLLNVNPSVVKSDKTPPSNVTGFSALTAGSNQVDLSWEASTDETSLQSNLIYEICISTSSGGCSNFTVSYTSPPGATSFSATGLTPLTTYYFSIRAKDEALNSGNPSLEISSSTSAAGTVNNVTYSPAPGNFSNNISVTLSTTTSGATICYTTDGQDPVCNTNGSCSTGTLYSASIAVNAASGNTTTLSLKSNACKTGFTVSNISSAVYKVDKTPPSAVAGEGALAAGANQINLNWTAATDDVTLKPQIIYEICQSTVTGGCDAFSITYTTGAGAVSYNVTGLSPLTPYYFRIRAKDAQGNVSASSTQVSATTDATGTVNTPTFSPSSALTYDTDKIITISSTTSGATICYSKDGTTTPACNASAVCTAGLTYSVGFTVTSPTTVKAIACKAGFTNSGIASTLFNIIKVSYPTQYFRYGVAGTTLTPTVTAGGPITSAIISPSLIGGLSINGTSGVISGTTSQTTGRGYSQAHTVTISNANGSVFVPVNIYVLGNQYPAKTGQTLCYAMNGSTSGTITCTLSQDGQVQKGSTLTYTKKNNVSYPTEYFSDDSNGNRWLTCPVGLSDASCTTGSIASYTAANAATACSDLNALNGGAGWGGWSFWRLPSKNELETLVNYGTSGPAISTTDFPATSSFIYWTSNAYDFSKQWAVDFTGGIVWPYNKTDTNKVRCSGNSTTPYNFTDGVDNQDGTVNGIDSGLVWTKCPLGMTMGAACTGTAGTYGFQDALLNCSSMTYDSRNWRLPNVNELKTLTDLSFKSPAMSNTNRTIFSSVPVNGHFWTSTTDVQTTTSAWYVNFADGSVYSDNKAGTKYVLCVSDGP